MWQRRQRFARRSGAAERGSGGGGGETARGRPKSILMCVLRPPNMYTVSRVREGGIDSWGGTACVECFFCSAGASCRERVPAPAAALIFGQTD